MKKYGVIGAVWLAVLLTIITCSSKASIEYEIYFDTHTEKTYELKEEIQEAYERLVSGVHEESYVLMVLHNLSAFQVEKDIHVEWRRNKLIITQGDGKGVRIDGELIANSVCMPRVQPRSFLQELFG